MRLLFDAARLQLRSGAGPFRCLGRIAVIPRPYQLVPLLMALRLDPVRLLIADDVGVGKTIEAGLIARELLDRGLINRVGVLCPPHLTGQWEAELSQKFSIDAAVISSSRMASLERALPRPDLSVFAHHRHLVASIDLVKSERYRSFFVDNAPDLVIVDEAHGASATGEARGAPQQRHRLLRELAADSSRSLILATATPHSGIESGFRSLLGLLDPDFNRPDEQRLPHRRVARHFLQRKRQDVARWLGSETPFPDRESSERPYQMTPEYERLYQRVRSYLREFVGSADGMGRQQRRVRYWAATAILRCLLSSPAAAAATLAARRKRRLSSPVGEGLGEFYGERSDFEQSLLDSAEEEEASDYVPTAALNDPAIGLAAEEIARLDRFLAQARRLAGPATDAKLAACADALRELLADGFCPIVYCRFVPTAEYVAESLEELLGSRFPGLVVRSVTGADGDSEQRKEIVGEIVGNRRRVLVATDCLSEGINLQESFDAVIHYDLPWNPNRLEQREGRVDRYGQPSKLVRTVLLYGSNNAIDLTVLEVLIRKSRAIRQRWGITVPVPDSDEIVSAVIEGVLEHRPDQGRQLLLSIEGGAGERFGERLEEAARREELSRNLFAQHAIRPQEVARELAELESALGNAGEMERFFGQALPRFEGTFRKLADGFCQVSFGRLESELAIRLGDACIPEKIRFVGPFPGDENDSGNESVVQIGRCHPVTEFLAERVLSRSLDPGSLDDAFGRCAVIATDSVNLRCVVAVLRQRYVLGENRGPKTFAEEVLVRAYERGEGGAAQAIDEVTALELLRGAKPATNLPTAERNRHLDWALGILRVDSSWTDELAVSRAEALAQAHERLRGQIGGRTLLIKPHQPPDLLGLLVLVPVLG